jgi:sugar lactone lactonase YvrE
MRPVIYKVPLGPGGEVVGGFEEISLSGDYVHMTGFNANGIAATPDGDRLIIVQSGAGLLFNVDPETGVATTIDLGGYSVSAGDGLLLQGRTLYVARNQLNLIAEIQLDPDFLSGVMVNEITDPLFDIPTTLASFGNGLYAVNARFTSGMDPSLAYSVIRVER